VAAELSPAAVTVVPVSTALYRRYRPESFADVIGQEHVTEPLMQALRTGRIHHAYLFSGPRGCGKTTSARILARCLNCEQGPTDTPCGVCDSCVGLARDGSGTVDVIEIDAASHGGVDDARDLREKASFGPAASRYKIYIIDEAHMVTAAGFNALLKVVEEPPPHVKFVFATTEPEKVIGTIRSRTHHYPFRLVPPARLQDYLARLSAAEGVDVAKGVLPLVVRAGGGSVRDSLSVLDQLIAGSDDDGVTYERAVGLLGYTDAALLDSVVEAFAAGDGATVFTVVDRVIESGHEPRRFVEDLLERLRDLVVISAVPDGAASILRGVPEDQLDRMRQQAAHFGAAALSRAADVVNTGLTELTGATSPRLQLELLCARVLLPGAEGESGYGARLDRIERRLNAVGTGAPVVGAPASAPSGAGTASAASSASAEWGSSGARSGASTAASSAPASAESGRESATSDSGSLEAPARERGTRMRDSATSADAPAARAQDDRGAWGVDAAVSAPPPAPVAARTPGALDAEAIRTAWPRVVDRLFSMKKATWSLVKEHAKVLDFDGRRLVLGISSPGLASTFRAGAHAEFVRQALIDELAVDAQVEAVHGDVPPARQGAGASRSSGSARGAGAPAGRPGAPASRPPSDRGGSGGSGGAGGRSTDRRSDRPADAGSDRPSDRPTDRPADAPRDRPSDRRGDRPSSVSPDTSAERSTEPAADRPTNRPTDRSSARGSGRSAPPVEPPGWDDIPPPTEEPGDPEPGPDLGPGPSSGPNAGTEPGRGAGIASARGRVAGREPGEPSTPARVAPADDEPSADDLDADDSGLVGRPVVERFLGGRVIDETTA
jgi:DNA polymerase-3 subunit gamma/tau